jgi:hypothetical protein
MQAFKKLLMAIAALGALAFGGAQIAGATGGSNDTSAKQVQSVQDKGDGDGEQADDVEGTQDKGDGDGEQADDVVTGAAAGKASAAAVKAVGGGTAKSVEKADEGGKAVYEVKVDKSGTITEVTLGSDYSVVGQQADDDQGHQDQGDGDGETQDDAAK